MMKNIILSIMMISSFKSFLQGLQLDRGIFEMEGISSKLILKLIEKFEDEIDAIHSYIILKNSFIL